MTRRKETPITPLDEELEAYSETPEYVDTADFKIPTFSLAANGRVIIVYNFTGEVNTDTIVQFRNLYSSREVGRYDHNGATVLVE